MTPGEQQYLERLQEEYRGLLHAMQTGVKFTLTLDEELKVEPEKRATSPKHLRVGVNAAMIDSGAIADLLLEKGIFTEEEYYKMLIQKCREEVDRYEKELSERVGKKITLL